MGEEEDPEALVGYGLPTTFPFPDATFAEPAITITWMPDAEIQTDPEVEEKDQHQ